MIWLVWETTEDEDDALRIEAEDCTDAAEEWARRDGGRDPANTSHHLEDGLRLYVRADGAHAIHLVQVHAEASISYYARELDP